MSDILVDDELYENEDDIDLDGGYSEGDSERAMSEQPKTTWAVTAVTHTDCAVCLQQAVSAITIARVTGSTGATSSVDHREPAPSWDVPGHVVVDHSATVTRAIAVLEV